MTVKTKGNGNIVAAPAINKNEWFKNWFDSSFYHKLYANRNEKEAAGFIDELLNELGPPVQSPILDLGCGNGRHSKYLASKGFNVTGIDLASSSIHEAKKAGTSSLRFYRHDMRVPFGKNCFSYVSNFFTSFGYFKTREEDHKVIANISSSLKPGGILVMDYINSHYAEKKLVPREKKEVDGIIYNISRWTDENHFFKKIVIEDVLFGDLPEYVEQVRKFSLADFDQLFNTHQLQVQQVYGDYQLNEYNKETSPRLILIAKKA
jgi:2-polyprenyl-3-methyl-5-hydroxy-6-metoxy-1,4-benzoquinol methylase